MRLRRALAAVASDRSGNITVLMAGGIVMLAGSAAFAVDIGSLYLEKRRLQGIADVAALSAASESGSPDAAARTTIAANNAADARLKHADRGRYTPDPTVDRSQRFVPGGSGANAVRVSIARDVPLFFGRFLLGKQSAEIEASATAAQVNLAAFSLGSRLAEVNGGLPGAILSGLAGSALNLTVMDYQALVGADVDLLAFTSALRTRASLQGATFGETLAHTVTLPQVLSAMADASQNPAAQSTLRALSLRVPNTTIQLSRLIDLGPLAGDSHADPTKPLPIDSYAMVREVLQLANGQRQVVLNLGAALPGLVSIDVRLAIGERPVNSPWLGVTSDGGVVVRTAQARLFFDTRVAGSATIGLATLRVPIFIELAQARASLASVSCPSGPNSSTVAIDVVPSVGQVSIADIGTSGFDNFTTPVTLQRAVMAQTLLARVTGQATVNLGGTASQQVQFTSADIAAGRVATVSTRDLSQGIVASLVRSIDLQVSALGLGVNASALTGVIGTALGASAPALDTLVADFSDLLGVHVGQADLRVSGVRCGRPVLVG